MRGMTIQVNAHPARAPPTGKAEAPEGRKSKLALGRLRQPSLTAIVAPPIVAWRDVVGEA
jgi:hypothetical protein